MEDLLGTEQILEELEYINKLLDSESYNYIDINSDLFNLNQNALSPNISTPTDSKKISTKYDQELISNNTKLLMDNKISKIRTPTDLNIKSNKDALSDDIVTINIPYNLSMSESENIKIKKYKFNI